MRGGCTVDTVLLTVATCVVVLAARHKKLLLRQSSMVRIEHRTYTNYTIYSYWWGKKCENSDFTSKKASLCHKKSEENWENSAFTSKKMRKTQFLLVKKCPSATGDGPKLVKKRPSATGDGPKKINSKKKLIN